MKVFIKPFILTFLMLLGSCSFLVPSPDESTDKSDEIVYPDPLPGWVVIDPYKSDLAYQNPSSGAIFLGNSQCKRHGQPKLETLNLNILEGIEKLKIQKKKEIIHAGRKAIETHAQGYLDGVPVWFKILTLNRDFCTYDFSLISAKKKISISENQDFEKYINKVRFQP